MGKPRSASRVLAAGLFLAASLMNTAWSEPTAMPLGSGSPQAWMDALWPADIAQQADAYLQRHEAAPQADTVAQLRDAAQRTAELLRTQDVRLYRAAFEHRDEANPQAAEQLEDRRRAALGDPEAAWRQAQLWPEAHKRRLGWLHLAELLGSGRAAYELALHYRRDGQPLLAGSHEAKARSLGWQLPSALDHARK